MLADREALPDAAGELGLGSDEVGPGGHAPIVPEGSDNAVYARRYFPGPAGIRWRLSTTRAGTSIQYGRVIMEAIE